MKPLAISDARTIVLGLQDEIRRSDESRYDHRLHGVLLVAQGMTCPAVGRLLGDGPQTVRDWVRRFEARGLAGLADGERPGRPRRLRDRQLAAVQAALRRTPAAVGLTGNRWDGKTVSAFIKQRFDIPLGVRRCQALFTEFGFRFRKPRPLLARADPAVQARDKKPPTADAEPAC